MQMKKIRLLQKASKVVTAAGFIALITANPSDDSATFFADFVISKILSVAVIALGVMIYRYCDNQLTGSTSQTL